MKFLPKFSLLRPDLLEKGEYLGWSNGLVIWGCGDHKSVPKAQTMETSSKSS